MKYGRIGLLKYAGFLTTTYFHDHGHDVYPPLAVASAGCSLARRARDDGSQYPLQFPICSTFVLVRGESSLPLVLFTVL